MTKDPALFESGDVLTRARLNRIISLDPDIGHDAARITATARSLRLAIADAHVGRFKVAPHLAGDYSPPPPRAPECMTAPVGSEARLSYATSRGIRSDTVSASRFDGTWCLWTARLGSHEVSTLQTQSAMDSTSALRANVNQVLDANGRDYPKMFRKLHEVVDDWEATVKGHTTQRTMTSEQLRELGTRPDCKDLSAAALNGDPRARRECLSLLRFDELEREMNRDLPRSVTWSMWTSKGHPEDRQLVVTRRAIDALSFHELNPDRRSRYVSFDGLPTPARDGLIDRSLSLMPPSSRVIVAADCSPSGRALAETVEQLALKYPNLTCQRSEPTKGLSWNEQLRADLRPSREPAPPRRPTFMTERKTGPQLER